MPKLPHTRLPRYVHGYVDNRGKPRYYFRRAGRARVSLPGLPWSPDFMDAYAQALKAAPAIEIGIKRSPTGSIAELVAVYLGSTAWQDLSQGTRRLRSPMLERFREKHGPAPVVSLGQKDMARMLAELKPSLRVNWRTTLRGLFTYGVEHSLCEIDPTEGVKARKAKTDGHHTWTEDEIRRFEAYWPSGSLERLAFSLMLWTGAAVSDAVKLGRQSVRNGAIYYARQKTGSTITGIPILPELKAELDQVEGRMIFIAGARGAPLTAGGLGNLMRRACRLAGLPALPSHGLRKACARRLAERGCSVPEIMAVLGHTDPKMAIYYCREAEKTRLAGSAMARLAETDRG